MSTHELTTGADLDILTDLDFVPTLPCESSQHEARHADEPAAWIASRVCPACRMSRTFLVCESGRQQLIRGPVHCSDCLARFPTTTATFRPIGASS